MKLAELFEAALKEARKPHLKYTSKEVKGKVDRVIVQLESHESGTFTKLAKRYKELDDALDALTIKRNDLNAETKEKVLDLFDAEDEVLTRVVETVSMTATMSKLSQPSPKVDYEKILKALIELTPELTEKVKELEKQFTTVPSPKSPALSVKVNEGMVGSFITKMKNLLERFQKWGKSYDVKLAKIKAMM